MKPETLTINRKIDAPLSAVWQCWSEAEFVSVWYGPGIETIMHYFDFQEGGYWQEEMRAPNGSMFGRSDFVEIIPGRKIVLRQYSVDEHGQMIANPMMPNWPETMQAEVMFVEGDDFTEMNFRWFPHEANDEEIACFNEMVPNMGKGWEKGFEILEREAKALATA